MSAREDPAFPLRGPCTILVLGATGARGGCVARHLLARGFAVRALTRDPTSEASRALRAAGAEPVAADLGDRPSLRSALAGCWGAFGLVSLRDSGRVGDQHARNLVHAVAAADLEHFVLSLPPEEGDRPGIEAYARSLGLAATYLWPGLRPEALGRLVGEIFAHPGPFVGRTLTGEAPAPIEPVLELGAATRGS